MQIQINGENKNFDKELSITQLLEVEKVKMPEMVTVEYNGEFLDRENFNAIFIKEGDKIEFLYFMGGGAIGF